MTYNKGIIPKELQSMGDLQKLQTPPNNTGIDTDLDQAILAYGNAIVDLHERFKSTDKRKQLDWETFDSYCKHEERQLKQAITKAVADAVEKDRQSRVSSVDFKPVYIPDEPELKRKEHNG